MYIKIISMLLVFVITSLSQTNTNINKDRYNYLIDSLSLQKSNYISEKETLIKEISILEKRMIDLTEQLMNAQIDLLVKKYGKENGMRIAQGRVWKGMTEKMLKDSWGEPDKITKNKEKWGTFTQWYYGKITYFFKDGVMIDWEELK